MKEKRTPMTNLEKMINNETIMDRILDELTDEGNCNYYHQEFFGELCDNRCEEEEEDCECPFFCPDNMRNFLFEESEDEE